MRTDHATDGTAYGCRAMKRYAPDFNGKMLPAEDGRWVSFDDYSAARAPLDVERPVERPVVATRCVCSHHWVDHTTWCDSNGCPCRFTGTADRHGADARAPLNVERLARALDATFPKRWNTLTLGTIAAAIAREYAALEEPRP
jgi:hypothetical protein